jgi:ubiquinone/menaquinone biosynthesis C-methylase UbiE
MRIAEELLDAWQERRISSAIAVMELLLNIGDVDRLTRWLRAFADSSGQNRYEELLRVVEGNRDGCARALRIARRFEAHADRGGTPEARVATTRVLFDQSVADSEEASVALYSFGNAEVLDAATGEVVRTMRGWGLLDKSKRILQIGCGVGRFEVALAPHVALAVGVDIAPKMIEAAQRRAAGLTNVRFEVSNGLDLRLFEDDVFDVVYAVDSMPYIVDAGSDLVEAHFREAARVLARKGEFVIFAFSYRADTHADRADVERLARAHGFRVLLDGTSPFDLWNGRVFRMARAE